MKKVATLVLLSLITLSAPLVAEEAAVTNTGKVKIFMILWRGETNAEKGFREGLAKHNIPHKIKVIDSKQDRSKIAQLIRKEDLSNYDYIYTFGTSITRIMYNFTSKQDVKFIFNIVSDPYGANILPRDEPPSREIAGVSNAVDLDKLINKALKYMPGDKILVIYNPKEKNSTLFSTKARRIARDLGLTIDNMRISADGSPDQLQAALDKKLRDAKDLTVLIPPDSYLLSNAELVATTLNKHKVFSLSPVGLLIKHGVAMGVSADYYKLGMMAADILHDNYNNNIALKDMALKLDTDPRELINEETFELLGIKPEADAT